MPLFDLLLLLFDSLFCLECFHCELQLVHNCLYGEMAERPIASDCKSDDSRLRRFESYSPQILIPISWALSSFGYPLKRTRSACLGEKRYPPLAYSSLTKYNAHLYGPLAHLARAPALHAGGDRFDSDRVQIYIHYNYKNPQSFCWVILCYMLP